MNYLIFLAINVLLLVWRSIWLYNWFVHPTETLQRIIKRWKIIRKVFFFFSPFLPYGLYERNPEYAIRRAITGEIIMMGLATIGCVLGIVNMVAGK